MANRIVRLTESDMNRLVKKVINEQKLNEDAGWSKILFGRTIKEIWNDIYSEINPILKYKKMKKYRQQLIDDIEQSKREIEEKKRAIQKLESELKEKKYPMLKNLNQMRILLMILNEVKKSWKKKINKKYYDHKNPIP